MARKVTLMTGQWTDLSLDEIACTAKSAGYDGLEIAAWSHIDLHKVASSLEYAASVRAVLDKYGLGCWALASHLIGHCVGEHYDERLDAFAPKELAGKPMEIREWAVEEMKYTARAAKALGIGTVTGFMGSPIWRYWYAFPPTTKKMIDAGYAEIKRLWSPILDVFDECGVRFALEVHPTQIAFNYYSAKRYLETFDYRGAACINFDPSHLIWQGVDPAAFLSDFAGRVIHVHMKDAYLNRDVRAGLLGSHLPFGDFRRGWDFVSLGHGDIDFDKIIRVLNEKGYGGPLSVEWEDCGMDRVFGARESCEFVRRTDFPPSAIASDAAYR